MPPIRQVRDDDGTLVPFRERKVADAIHAGLVEAGASDRALAEELAGVVTLFLERKFGDPGVTPSVDDVQDMIERVLEETGNTRAARCFHRQRQQRDEMRDLITVRHPAVTGTDDVVLPDDAGSDDRLSRWSRGRLLHTLTEEAELPPSLADEVAVAVERRVFASGLKCVTTDFIRQLLEHELFERGLGGHPMRDDRVVVARGEVVRQMFADAADPVPAERALAGPILARFALAELHSPAVARAHREGRLHLHGLDRPLALERLVLPAPLLGGVGDGPAARGLLRLRRHVDAIRAHVAGAIEIPGLLPWLATRSDAADTDAVVDDLVAALSHDDAFGTHDGPLFEIDLPLGGFGAGSTGEIRRRLSGALVDRLLREPALTDRWRVTLVAPRADERQADSAREAAEELALSRTEVRIRLTRDDDADPWAAAPCAAPVPLRVSLARATVNLPLLFLDVAGRGLREALPELNEGLRLVLESFRERFWQQRRGAPYGVHGVVVHFGGPGEVQVRADAQEVDLEVWGLPIALDLLVRRGVITRATIPEAAARILGYIDYVVAEEHDGVGFHVRLGGCRSRAVRRRLFSASEQIARRFGITDLSFLLKGEHSAEGVLPVAAPLLERKNAPLLDAPFLMRLGFGLAVPAPALPNPLDPAVLGRLAQESRLGSFAVTRGTSAEGLFEVQEELFS